MGKASITENKRRKPSIKHNVSSHINIDSDWYKAVIQSSPDGFLLIKHPGGDILDVNDAFCNMLGYNREELLTMNIRDIEVGFDESSETIQNRSADIEEVGVASFETRHRRKDGKIMDVAVSLRYLNEGLSFCFHRDITEQKKRQRREQASHKRTKETLKETEDRYRMLIELGTKIGEAVVMLQDIDNREGMHTYVSDQWPQITGYSREELLNMSFFDLVCPKDKEISAQRHREKMSGKAIPDLFELSITSKDGEETSIEITSAATHYKGEPTNVVYIRDVTERKQAEFVLKQYRYHLEEIVEERSSEIIYQMEEHKRTKEQLQFILDSLPVYIFYKNKNGKDLYKNSANIRATNESKEKNKTLHDNLMIRRDSQNMEVIKNKKPIIQSISCINNKWFSTSRMLHINSNGDVVGLVGLTIDISNIKQKEQKIANLLERERKIKLQLEDEIKNRIYFTRALVHEIKTPLTPLMLLSEIMSNKMKGKPWGEYANEIYNNVFDINLRIDQLYEMVKSETGQLKLDKEKTDIINIIEQVELFMAPQFETKKQKFSVELPPHNVYMNCDRNRIKEVLINLLDNSFKYTEPNGIIKLKADIREESVVIEIKDTGIGIPMPKQGQLFMPYKRATCKKGIGGLGIGLFLVKTIIEMHGGRIWYKSREGKGSTFYFSLPITAPNIK